ncbi:MAG: hypothetical protein ABI091_26935 [Ferruginibacter sp.]
MQNKITLSTFKSFLKKNEGKLFVNVKSDFDGMTDGVIPLHKGFEEATKDKTVSKDSSYYDATLGINGIWLVRGNRDYFNYYKDETFTGISVSNSCGHFIVATKIN